MIDRLVVAPVVVLKLLPCLVVVVVAVLVIDSLAHSSGLIHLQQPNWSTHEETHPFPSSSQRSSRRTFLAVEATAGSSRRKISFPLPSLSLIQQTRHTPLKYFA